MTRESVQEEIIKLTKTMKGKKVFFSNFSLISNFKLEFGVLSETHSWPSPFQ